MKSVFPGQYDDDNSLEEASDPEREEITNVVRAIEAAIAAVSAPQSAQKNKPLTDTEATALIAKVFAACGPRTPYIEIVRETERAHRIGKEQA